MKTVLPVIIALALMTSGCTKKYKQKSANKKYVAKLFEKCAAYDGIACKNLASAAERVTAGAYVYKLSLTLM